MKKHILSLFLVLAAFALPASADEIEPATGDISADAAQMTANDDYFICLQILNLTGYPVCIDRVGGTEPSITYHGAGTVIPVPADDRNASDAVCYIGWRRNSAAFSGPDMTVEFHLVGHEGAQPCTMTIQNPFGFWDDNTVDPEQCFPEGQCPPYKGDGAGAPVPLYHNIVLPKDGHYLSVVATLAFRNLHDKTSRLDAEASAKVLKSAAEAAARAKTITREELLNGK